MKNFRRSSAFTLIELSLYMTFLFMITYGAFSFFGMVQHLLSQQSVCCESAIRDLVVLDLLKRDIMTASPERLLWNEGAMLWRKEMLNKHGQPFFVWVQWQLVDNGISRTEGVYDHINKKWLKKKSNFFGCSFKHISVQLKYDKTQAIVMVMLAYQQALRSKKEEFICLRNRVLL